MADQDWDQVTRIGSSVRRSGNTTPKEKVVKGNSALNAAQRAGGILSTEKKYGGTNQASNPGGQHLTKVDRSDEIIKPKTVGLDVGRKITQMRDFEQNPGLPGGKTLTRKEFAAKCSISENIMGQFEAGTFATTDPNFTKNMNTIERNLNIILRGDKFGEPKFKPKK